MLECVTSIQADLLRFTQTLLIDSVGKRKVGAQTCKFQALIVIRSKVMSFRTHAQILQEWTGEVIFAKWHNFRTEHDENVKLKCPGTNFPFYTRVNNSSLADSQQVRRYPLPHPGISGVLLLTAFEVQELSTECESWHETCASVS